MAAQLIRVGWLVLVFYIDLSSPYLQTQRYTHVLELLHTFSSVIKVT